MSTNTSFWTDESTCVLIDLNHINIYIYIKKHTQLLESNLLNPSSIVVLVLFTTAYGEQI